MSGLTALRLSGNGITDVGAEALARSPVFAGLAELDLSHNQIGDAGAGSLAASPTLGRLAILGLVGNRLLTPAGGLVLLRSPFLTALARLDLPFYHPWPQELREGFRDRFGLLPHSGFP